MIQRLDKFLSVQTSFTRSEIKKLLMKNKVSADGKIVRDGSIKIDPEVCKITLDGKNIGYKDKVYIIMNKPEGYVCATEDKNEKTVLDLLMPDDRRKDLFPAGRLDKDTTGMVLITNDGELSHKILSPKSHIAKYYLAELENPFKDEYIQLFRENLKIDGGDVCLPAEVRGFEKSPNTALLQIYEGKFHQVKRMFSAVENKVTKLCRIQMGDLPVPKKLGAGEYVEILHKDVEKLLKHSSFEIVYNRIFGDFSS